MLNHTLEFLRIADVQPSDEKVRKRRQAAAELVTQISAKENRRVLLALLQGVVAGFDAPPFAQESPTIILLIKSIKDGDATLPQDLKENATELRAISAIAVGELLTNQPDGRPAEEGVVAALSLNSALSSRPVATNKYIRWMLETLSTASHKVLYDAARRRRQRATSALSKLEKLKKPPEETDLWDTLMPVVEAALREVNMQQAIDREEIETLWWMFGAYSEIEQKPVSELSPCAAAFCAGIELAERALLPPSPSASAMVKRAVESGREAAALGSVSLQDATGAWSESMRKSLSPPDADDMLARYPALFPLSLACQRLRECKNAPKLGKDFAITTGVPLTFSQSPANWGAQIFREMILQRYVMNGKES